MIYDVAIDQTRTTSGHSDHGAVVDRMGGKSISLGPSQNGSCAPGWTLIRMQEQKFAIVLETIISKDPRYHRDAYLFVREALDHAQKLVCQNQKTPVRHITGRELLEGIRDYGITQYGPMTLTVFNEWGIHQCEDFGEIVFNMVEHKLLSKTPQDSREDFKNGYDFNKAFREPYLPQRKISISDNHNQN